MRVAVICAVLMAFSSLTASLVGAVIAQSCYPGYAEPVTLIALIFVGLPLGLYAGLQLSSIQREVLAERLCRSERVLFILGLITASGCAIGMLGNGKTIPTAIGVFATVGAMVGTACILLGPPRHSERRHRSKHHRTIP
jgi:hypothetical protein